MRKKNREKEKLYTKSSVHHFESLTHTYIYIIYKRDEITMSDMLNFPCHSK